MAIEIVDLPWKNGDCQCVMLVYRRVCVYIYIYCIDMGIDIDIGFIHVYNIYIYIIIYLHVLFICDFDTSVFNDFESIFEM